MPTLATLPASHLTHQHFYNSTKDYVKRYDDDDDYDYVNVTKNPASQTYLFKKKEARWTWNLF